MSLETNNEDWEKSIPKFLKGKSQNAFTVPQDYFDSLSDIIHTNIFSQELKDKIKDPGFTAPEGYFQKLPIILANKIQNIDIPQKKPKLFRLNTSWVKYAAAACITIGVSSGIYFNNTSSDNSKEINFGTVPDQSIVNYLQINSDAGDTNFIIENINVDGSFSGINTEISNTELEEYINSTAL